MGRRNGGPADEPAVAAVLAEGRQAYLAVPSRRGPHATPALYSFMGSRIGVFAASETVKAKVVRKKDRGPGLYTGLLVRTPKATALLTGPVTSYDLLRPPIRPNRHVHALTLGTGFLLRNSVDLAAFARDTFQGKTGLPPGRRVLLTMEPDRAAVITSDDIAVFGEPWPGDAVAGPELAAGDADVAVFTTEIGLVPVPALWDDEKAEIEVAGGLVDLTGATDGPACVVTDDYIGPGPAAKKGELAIGSVHAATGSSSGRVRFRLEETARSEWSGVKVRSRKAAAPS